MSQVDVFEDDVKEETNKADDKNMMDAMEVIEKSESNHKKVPAYISHEWQDYVLNDYLRDDEKFDGLPTNAGLRRAVEDLLGGIEEISCSIVSSPSDINNGRAVANCFIRLSSGKCYSDCADSYDGNTDAVYRKYPVAIATTRAENRALRKALRLSVVSKDEVSDVASEDTDVNIDNPHTIAGTQIKAIEMLAKRAKINLQKLIEVNQTEGEKETELKKLAHSKAVFLIKLLNEYIQDKEKIPSELLETKEKN